MSYLTNTIESHFIFLFLFAFVHAMGCGQSQQFAAVPPGVNAESVTRQTYQLKAERFKFTPDVIHVKVGTLVRLEVTSIQGDHGFQLGAFGIDEALDENQTRIVEFYASKQGEYGFRCSHFCGIGHMGMNGKIVVE
jgi:heme/copper-type cytochrome/quinol oxidase subunit 2